ncbi:MAG TPA: hypothetical protein VJB02_01485, partial [Coxiellaceae bacterium]|nr:hypothetical protein [Coxiellaceae bacterium]
VLFDRQMERTAEGSTERAVVLREAAQGEWTFLTRLRADQFFQLAMSLPPSETRYQPPVRRGQSVGLRALDYLTSPWLSALNHWKSQASSNPEIRELLRGYILKLLTARSTADTNLHALALLTDEITPEWVNSRPEWNDPSQRLALYRRLTDVRVTDQEMSVLYSAGDATATAIDARWAAIFSMLKLTPAQWDAYLPTHWLDEDRPLFVRDEGSPDPDRFVPPHPSQETLTHSPSELSFVFTDMGVPLRFEYLDEIFKHYKNSPRIMERFVKEHRDFFAALPEEQRLEFLGALYQFIRLDAAKNLNAERIWRPFVDSLVPPVVGDMRWQEDPVTIAVPVSREAPDGVAYVNGFCRWSLEAVSRAHPKLWASSPREDGTESYAIQGRGYERKDCCGTDLACHRLGNHFDVWTTEEVVKVTRLALTPRFAEFMALWAHAPLVAHNLTIFSLGDERWRTYEGRRFRFYCIVGGESIEQLNRLARALYETGRFHEARACLDRATFVSNTLREWESVGDYTISGLPSVITLEHLPPIERPFSDVQDYFNRQWLNLIGTPATGGAEATGLYAEMDENTPAWKSVILGEGTVSATVRGIFQGVTAFGFENVLRRLDHLERLIELAQTGRITDFYKAKATSFTSLKVGGVHYSDVVMALPYHLFELPLQREAKLQWVREQRDRVWALYAALGGKNRARLERQLRAEEALPAAAAASAGAKPAMGGGGGGAAAAAGAGAPRASPAAAPAAAASAPAVAVAAAPAAAAPLDAAASAGSGSAAAAAGAFSMRQT